MSEENPAPDIDWHRLSNQATLTFEDLVTILFGLKLSYLENLPPQSPADHKAYAEAAHDLLFWILEDDKNGNLICDSSDQRNPFFPTHKIGLWIFNKKILFWLINQKRVVISLKGCDFLEQITYGHVLEPLETNETGSINWRHYASLTSWRIRVARQILEKANPGKSKKIIEAMQESLSGRDANLIFSAIPPMEEERTLRVFPGIFCVWATNKGFHVPDVIYRIFVTEKRPIEEAKKMRAIVEENMSLRNEKDTGSTLKQVMPQPVEKISNELKVGPTVEPDNKQGTGKQKGIPPNPTTYKVKMNYLRKAYISKVSEKLIKDNDLNSADLWKDPDLKALIRDSGLSNEKKPKEKTIKERWIPEARKIASVPGNKGVKKRKY